MAKEKTTFNASTVIKTAVISGIFSSTFGFFYNVSIKFFFEPKGNLIFESPVVTYFRENSNKFSVVNVNVRNIGNNVVENISFRLDKKES